MHLFDPLEWGKTCAAVGKTNTYLIAWKLCSKTRDSVNNISISPHNRFFTWNKARFSKNMSKICNKTLEKAWLIMYSERAFENLCWYLCSKFFQNSCGDISVILMMISRKGLQPATLTKKPPFIWILSRVYQTCMNHHSVAASKQSVSEIFWNLERSLWMKNLLFYHIKHKTICLLFYFWKYENIYRKVIRNWDEDFNESIYCRTHSGRQTKKCYGSMQLFCNPKQLNRVIE